MNKVGKPRDIRLIGPVGPVGPVDQGGSVYTTEAQQIIGQVFPGRINKPAQPDQCRTLRDAYVTTAADRQLSIAGFGPELDDGFCFTWWNTREGAAAWIEHRGSWRPGVVVWCYRKSVSVILTGRQGNPVHVRREYGELRRRVVKPKLVAIDNRRAENSTERRTR